MGKGVGFLYLCQEEVLATGLDMRVALDLVEKVLGLHEKQLVNLPSKVVLDLGERERGRINAMPAYVGGDIDICGIKWIAGFPGNPRLHGLPRASAFIVLNDSSTGLPLCIMDGTYISALRTGAVTGVGARHLARGDAEVFGLIGCGVQAITQAQAVVAAVPSIRRIKGFDIKAEAARSCLARIERELGKETALVSSAEEAVVGSDIIATVTVADEPIVKDTWLKRGSLLAHVGSYQEEEEAVILNTDKVVVDVWSEVLHRGTPLVARMYNEGKIGLSRIHANIGEIINGDKPGRESHHERIFFSPMGLGSEDVAVAHWVYMRAKQAGLGTTLKLWDHPALEVI